MQDPGGAREILALSPEHSWANHSVPGVLWGKACAPLSGLLPAAAEGKGPWGSQLAGANGRLQLVGQGGENLVELLIAPGLAAAGSLAAPEETHLELSAEYLQELGLGLKPCRAWHRGPSSSWGGWGLHPDHHIPQAFLQGVPPPSSARNPTRFVDGCDHAV